MDTAKPALKGSVALFARRESPRRYTLRFLCQHSRIVTFFDVSTATYECIRLFNGARSVATIARRTGTTRSEVYRLVRYLVSQNLVESGHQGLYCHPRYSRQLNFFGAFETPTVTRKDYLNKLRSSHVAVLGAGGIGTWVIESLARSGVGELTVIDPDSVSIHNLPRQCIYCEIDVGKGKAQTTRDKIRKINAEVKVNAVPEMVRSPKHLSRLIDGASLVINCSDNPDTTTTNQIVSSACFSCELPHILCGGYDGHISFIGPTVVPYKTACWECYVGSDIYDRGLDGFAHVPVTEASIEGGTLACIASITASIHVAEAIKLLTGYALPSMFNQKAEFNLFTYSLARTDIARRANCSLCGRRPTKGRGE